MFSLRCLAAAALLLPLLPFLPQAQEAPPAPVEPAPATAAIKNLVIVTIDTVRADRLGCYGYFRDTSPRLDRLAAESLRFTRCVTPIAQTTPSHTSIFTGVGPLEHGVTSNHARRSKQDREELGLHTTATLRSLAESMKARGFATGGFVAATPVKKFTGLAAGFDAWTEPGETRRTGREVVKDALAFLDEKGSVPFFAWLHLFDAHEPLVPPYVPQQFGTRYAKEAAQSEWLAARGFPEQTADFKAHDRDVAGSNNLYDGALRFLDTNLGALLDRLDAEPFRSTTALVVVADHGTSMGQHGHVAHGLVWQEQLAVPLLIRVPGKAPAVVDTPLSTLDLWPTLNGLAPGLLESDWLGQCRGGDVLSPDHVERPLFALSGRNSTLASVLAGRFKLLREERGDVHLFDLDADPHEQHDLAAEKSAVVTQLRRLLDEEVARQKKANALHKRGAKEGEVDPKLLEELRELGYTGAEAGEEEDDDGGR